MDHVPQERQGADGHQQRSHRADLIDQGELRVIFGDTSRHAVEPQPVLRSEAEVEADEGQCAMQTPEVLIEEASCEFRVPVVDGGEDHEHRSTEDDVVEMSNDEVGVVDVNVERHLGQGDSGDSAQHEVHDEAAGEEHGAVEVDPSPKVLPAS